MRSALLWGITVVLAAALAFAPLSAGFNVVWGNDSAITVAGEDPPPKGL